MKNGITQSSKIDFAWDRLNQAAAADIADAKSMLKSFVEKSQGSRMATPLTVAISGSWGVGKSTTKKVILDTLADAVKRSDENLSQVERDKHADWKKKKKTREFFSLGGWVEQPPPQDTVYLSCKLNAWVYNGSSNVWASILLELYRVIEDEYGAFELRIGLADIMEEEADYRKKHKEAGQEGGSNGSTGQDKEADQEDGSNGSTAQTTSLLPSPSSNNSCEDADEKVGSNVNSSTGRHVDGSKDDDVDDGDNGDDGEPKNATAIKSVCHQIWNQDLTLAKLIANITLIRPVVLYVYSFVKKHIRSKLAVSLIEICR